MKIALLSDIHGNVFALEAVIRDARKRGVDSMLNLGDSFYGPIAPKSTYDLLMDHDMVTVRGNQDRQLYEAIQEEIDANPTLRFTVEDLGDAPLGWLQSLPFDRQVHSGIYLCHGTPADDTTYLLEAVQTGHPRLRRESEITALLAGRDFPVVVCGHSHIPRSVVMESGRLIVNPGSVGLPAYDDDTPVIHVMENHRPHASYAILERRGTSWTAQQMNVWYDYRKAAGEARKRHREDWAHWLTTGNVV